MMSVGDAIRSRRSVRIFTNEIVSMDLIHQIVEAGRWAPSATNKQETRFIYIDDKDMISSLYKLGTAHFVNKCKQMILVLYDNRIDNTEYHDDVLSAAAAIQNMLLQAYAIGVSTCWVANLPAKSALRKLFGIPSYYDPISLVVLGYSAHIPQIVKRKNNLSSTLFYNKFNEVQNAENHKSGFKLFIRKCLRKIYIRMPKTALVKKFAGKYEKKFDN